MTQPILVMMSWRGGERLARCLTSIVGTTQYFSRIVLSITAAEDSPDMTAARAFAAEHPTVEVIFTGRELPTMQHQAFWVNHLQATGTKPNDWIYWLAYDDQVRIQGIRQLVGEDGHWPLKADTAYFGPWAMRHETAEDALTEPSTVPLESWTSFPLDGPTRLPVGQWIAHQLIAPTYMQMSGSVCQFANYLHVRDSRPRKQGPMRIEMATAAAAPNDFIEEFPAPISIIYGRPNSDRASYGKQARKEDFHLAAELMRLVLRRPGSAAPLSRAGVRIAGYYLRHALRKQPLPAEQWVSRELVDP